MKSFKLVMASKISRNMQDKNSTYFIIETRSIRTKKKAEKIKQETQEQTNDNSLVQASLAQEYLIYFLYQASCQPDCSFFSAFSDRYLSSRDTPVGLVYYIAVYRSRTSPYSLSVWKASKSNEMEKNKGLLLLSLSCISRKLGNVLFSKRSLFLIDIIDCCAIY